ncbi:MAG: hypothetical protein AAF170_18955 [Bacteroidota bacterium]
MTDPLLDPYWDAVRTEQYQTHLRHLPARLERTIRRPAPARAPRLAWALGAVLVAIAVGFIPVPTATTTGVLLSGRSASQPMSEMLGALEALDFPAAYNLSVSEDSLGASFALFLPHEVAGPPEAWAVRVGAAVPTADLQIRTIDVVTDHALWLALLDRAGVTISASGATRAEIQEQVDRQLEALGTGHANVEHITGPDGRKTIRITIDDLP